MIRPTTYLLILLVVLTLAGCTGMKHISADDPLYTGHKIKFSVPDDKKKKLNPVPFWVSYRLREHLGV